MPTCSFAPTLDGGFTVVDNAFIQHFLPYATDAAVKVYLYGLMLCAEPLSEHNTLAHIADGLDLTPKAVTEAFAYWQSMGLVRVVSQSPFAVNYLSPSRALLPTRTLPKDKYSDFLVQLQELFPDRMMSSNELFVYLQFLEETHMDPQALLMIAKFCVERKNSAVKAAYVLTVARNWYQQGCTTLADAEARILEADSVSDELRDVFRALHKTAAPDIDDRQLYTKWTRNWGYAPAAIVRAAKTVKRGGMERLDSVLDGFFRAGVFSVEDIDKYIKTKDDAFALCIRVNKTLGLYYESLDYIVDTYITPWLRLGYSEESIVLLARYSAMRGVRTLEGMQGVVEKCYAQGVVDDRSVAVFLDEYATVEKRLARIIEATGSTRRPTENDRELYRTWSSTWGFDDEVILYAAAQSLGKPYPMANMGNLLSRWHADGLTGIAQIKEAAATHTPPTSPVKSAPRTTAKPQYIAPAAGDEFRRAEIRTHLQADPAYRKLDQKVRTLNMQVAHCQLDGQDVPLTLEQDLHEAQEARDSRVRELGYDPADV
jgi:DnaD/phage-associated family protein